MNYISGISELNAKALETNTAYKFANLKSTKRPLDIVAGQKNLFFQVENNNNSDLHFLTHVCALHSDQENYLIDENQNYVLDTDGEKINLGDGILHSVRGNKIVLLKNGQQSFAEQQIGLHYIYNPEIGLDTHSCQYFLANDKILQSPVTYAENKEIWVGYTMKTGLTEKDIQDVQNNLMKDAMENKVKQEYYKHMRELININ